jgi:hypothetical protein
MTDLEATEIVGAFRTPRNGAQNIKGSIHDDATAQRLGLRGGTVAGSVHLDLFPPIAIELWGQTWFETGTVSMLFKNATVDAEPVRAVVSRPAALGLDAQVDAHIERDDGMLVATGTLSVGTPSDPTALRAVDHNQFASGELRILEGVAAGDRIPDTEVTIDGARQEGLLSRGHVTDPLDWYADESPWGGPIACPQSAVHELYTFAAAEIGKTVRNRGGGVGLFGCIEVAHRTGPLLLDRTYVMDGVVLGVGQSPKTEYVWFETSARDDGRLVAQLVMQLRWMKASSPLYS